MLIIVLNDGETFSDAANCTLLSVPDDLATEEIEEMLRDNDERVKLIAEFKSTYTH